MYPFLSTVAITFLAVKAGPGRMKLTVSSSSVYSAISLMVLPLSANMSAVEKEPKSILSGVSVNCGLCTTMVRGSQSEW